MIGNNAFRRMEELDWLELSAGLAIEPASATLAPEAEAVVCTVGR